MLPGIWVPFLWASSRALLVPVWFPCPGFSLLFPGVLVLGSVERFRSGWRQHESRRRSMLDDGLIGVFKRGGALQEGALMPRGFSESRASVKNSPRHSFIHSAVSPSTRGTRTHSDTRDTSHARHITRGAPQATFSQT